MCDIIKMYREQGAACTDCSNCPCRYECLEMTDDAEEAAGE